jgi:uncharacterized protein YoxC
MSHEMIELACVGVGALALLMQAIILLAIYLGMRKATKSLKEEIEDVRSSVMPVVNETRELLTRLSRLTPKLESTVTDAAELTRSLRAQAADVQVSVEDILERVRKQTSRVDGMFSGTLDTVERASVYVNETIAKPVRQISALLAGLKAIIESLRSAQPSTNSVYRERGLQDDTDMFV